MIRINDLDHDLSDAAIGLPAEVQAVLGSMADFEAEAYEKFALHRMPGALLTWGTMDGEHVSSAVKWMPPGQDKAVVAIETILQKLHGIELGDMVPGRYLGLGVVSEAAVARDDFENMVLRDACASGTVPTVGVWHRIGTAVLASGWQLQINRPLNGAPRHAHLLSPLATGDMCLLTANLRRLGTYLEQRHPGPSELVEH
jgi:hypothetical protein